MYSDPLCINRQSSVQFVLGGSKWFVEARRQLGFVFAFLLKLYHRRDEGNLAKGRIAFASNVGSVVEILLRPSHPLVTLNRFHQCIAGSQIAIPKRYSELNVRVQNALLLTFEMSGTTTSNYMTFAVCLCLCLCFTNFVSGIHKMFIVSYS